MRSTKTISDLECAKPRQGVGMRGGLRRDGQALSGRVAKVVESIIN